MLEARIEGGRSFQASFPKKRRRSFLSGRGICGTGKKGMCALAVMHFFSFSLERELERKRGKEREREREKKYT